MIEPRRQVTVLQEIKSPLDQISPQRKGLAVDRVLVRRIVLSGSFAKSPRLSHFLRHICSEAEAGRHGEINEQSIGIAVFGRNPDYDSAVDSIVRSHASRLRHRLREYFEAEGAHEPVLLTIPKGSYVPRFELRSAASATQPERMAPVPIEVEVPQRMRSERSTAGHGTIDPHSTLKEEPSNVARRLILRLWVAVAVAATIAVACTALLVIHLRGPIHQKHHIFWSGFLEGHNGGTMLVESDSGLVILQHFTNRPVALASYISGAYLTDVASDSVKPDVVARLGSRRYTPSVDSLIYEKVSHLLPDAKDGITLRYARDLRLDELKLGNAILLGTRESDPWVELFEPSMNFVFQNDLAAETTLMQNRHPQGNELAEYSMSSNDPEHTVYGLVAYRPNLTHTGHVLIVEGQTMAGTQSASEFLLDDSHMLPFLTSIRRSDGSIPHFEVLIRSSSLGGESSRIELVAAR